MSRVAQNWVTSCELSTGVLACPPSYQRQIPPVRHKLCNGFDLRLQELFDQDQKRLRRERRTAQKLYEQFVVEGYTGSYSPVQRFVRDLKRAGTGSNEAFIPLHFAAGDALQFDWSEERVVLGGVEQKIKVDLTLPLGHELRLIVSLQPTSKTPDRGQCHCIPINQILRIRSILAHFCTLNYNIYTGSALQDLTTSELFQIASARARSA